MKQRIVINGLIGFFISGMLWAQEPEDTALAPDAFQNHYYESLKQKGIENYDKALLELDQCETIQPNNPVIFFEKGKNYYFMKRYNEAFEQFKKVTELDPKNRWAWVGMYDVCYDTKDYNRAITIVQKLIEFKSDYQEDLCSLYMTTRQYDKALDLINVLNATVGKSDKRELYKAQILQDAKYQGPEKNDLIEKIKQFPKDESNYIALIFMYSKSNQEEKALEVARQLEKEIPTSEWAQVSLFKYHLTANDGAKAVGSMNRVFATDKIDKKIKHRMLNEFLIFTKNNPQFEPQLDQAIHYFEDDKEVNVAKEIGKFYQAKNDWIKSVKYYEMHQKSHGEDMEGIVLLLQAYTESLLFDKVLQFSSEQLELFPTQPQLYYYNGLALNQQRQFKKAKEILESGLDFIVDDSVLEINFNLQLGEASAGLGDHKNKNAYFEKANQLLEKTKKN
jgi:tetratricopeptide (TPR) repeat protein